MPFIGIPDDAYEYDDGLIKVWVPQRQWKNDKTNEEHPLLRAQRYLSGYSSRALRYDTDALNAISGALNTFAKEGVYHTWGVPVTFPKLDPPKDSNALKNGARGKIALCWHHSESCPRRNGFSTWSPIGWTGTVLWRASESPQTVDVQNMFLLSDRQAANPRLSDAHYDPAHTLVQRSSAATQSQALELGVQVAEVWLFLATEYLQPPTGRSLFGAKMTFDNDHIVVFWPYWDVSPSDLNSTTTLVGAFLPLDKRTDNTEDCVLLLRARDQHYERVGILWSENVLNAPTVGESKAQAEYHLCEKTPWPIGTSSPYRLNALEHHELGRRYKDIEGGEWWRRLTRAETVVIR